jgi:septum formation inhibitor-activating ATPase MinD
VVRVIVNRANHGVRIPDIEHALKLPVSATIVSNGPKAVIASNEGAPIISRFPRDKITTDLHNVARLVTDGSATNGVEPSRRTWWSALVSRASSA